MLSTIETHPIYLRLMETGLFEVYPDEHGGVYKIWLILKDTRFHLRLLSDVDLMRGYWFDMIERRYWETEEVLQLVPPEVSVNLLFHLDLFQGLTIL